MTIFLDLDGVCVDFFKPCCRHFKVEHYLEKWPKPHVDLDELLNITRLSFWQIIDEVYPRIFLDLEQYPWFTELYSRLTIIGHVVFCSKPSINGNSAGDKLLWLQKLFGKTFDSYCFTPHKHYLANPGSILIDDNKHNCDNFIKHGGNAVLFPQQWNGDTRAAYDQSKVNEIIEYVNWVKQTLKMNANLPVRNFEHWKNGPELRQFTINGRQFSTKHSALSYDYICNLAGLRPEGVPSIICSDKTKNVCFSIILGDKIEITPGLIINAVYTSNA